MSFYLSIDQGTTSSRAMIYDANGKLVSQSQKEFHQYFPQDGWVEHLPEEIWETTLHVCRQALTSHGLTGHDIKAIGIANQRETVVIWDRKTGQSIAPAIVWQDRRTASKCDELRERGFEPMVREKTGLLLDPYFSATKIDWLLDHVPGARQRAEKGELCCGTIDSYLLWKLTGGKRHATDATNASRTALFNIRTQQWDSELLTMFNVPDTLLPEVLDSADDYGHTAEDLFNARIPICAMIGDQQGALVGQACFEPGMVKSTYGTGCFVVMNIGDKFVLSDNRLLTTTAYRIKGETTYGLEGSIFVAGAAIQWLRDGMGFIKHASECEALASSVKDSKGVVVVPAFTGLGAPYWEPNARGAIFGLTRDTQVAHITRATLNAVCFQTRDLLEAFSQDAQQAIKVLRVDGGMVKNNWLMQQLANHLNVRVERPQIIETTSLGAAGLAALQCGEVSKLSDISTMWHKEMSFESDKDEAWRTGRYNEWKAAVGHVLAGIK